MNLRTVLTIALLIVTFVFSNSHGLLQIPAHTSWSHTQTQTVSQAQNTHTLDETVAYLKKHQTLPNYYLTKEVATARGWIPSKGNLAEIAPGMTIGGGVFTNSEHLLPDTQGRIWYEADFDYKGGGRNAKRILYSNDALIYITRDHYKTIQQL